MSSGGQVVAVESFSDDDCSVRAENEVEKLETKPSGLGYREFFTINMPTISVIKEKNEYMFREGESDEEDDSDESSESSLEDLNEFDILNVCSLDSEYHKQALRLIQKFGKPAYTETFDVAEHRAIKITKRAN